MPQRRHFSRILFNADARLIDGKAAHPCELLDVSLKGALVRLPAGEVWTPAQACRLELTLGATREVVIRMDCQVAHREDRVLGLHCLSIDLDSITHLRRLVELNVGDEAHLQRELSALSPE